MQDILPRFARYVAHRWPDARRVEADELSRIHGGASRETYRLRVRLTRNDRPEERRLILRRDPTGSLIETDRACEFEAYRAFHGSAVPVPEPLWLEEDTSWLERPFFVMEEIQGGEASPQKLFEPPYLDHRDAIGEQKWTILGAIHRTDPATAGLDGVLPGADGEPWQRELAHWEAVIDEDEMVPQPIARAAIRWLRRTPPPPPQRRAVVHGDFRTGNFLVGERG